MERRPGAERGRALLPEPCVEEAQMLQRRAARAAHRAGGADARQPRSVSRSASPMELQPHSATRFISSQKMSSVSVEPTGSNVAWRSSCGRWRRLPAWAKSQSRRPQARVKGWVFASVIAPHVAWRMCSTNTEDSRCSHAATSWLRMLPCGGAGSFSTAAEGSPPG